MKGVPVARIRVRSTFVVYLVVVEDMLEECKGSRRNVLA